MSDVDPTAPPDDDAFTFVDALAPTDDPTHPSWTLAGPDGTAAFSDVVATPKPPDDPDDPEDEPDDPKDDGGHGGGHGGGAHTSTSPLGPFYDDTLDGTHGGPGGDTVPAGGGPTGGDTPPGSGTEPEGPHEPAIDFPEVPPDPQGPTDPPTTHTPELQANIAPKLPLIVAVSQADGPEPGPADLVALGILLYELLEVGAAASYRCHWECDQVLITDPEVACEPARIKADGVAGSKAQCDANAKHALRARRPAGCTQVNCVGS